MRFVSIKKAKALLYELVEEAEGDDEVILVRDSVPVAAIVKLDTSDLELVGRFEDARAAETVRRLASQSATDGLHFTSMEEASRFIHQRSHRQRRR